MVVCGSRFEVPTVLPNRTRSFVHDLKQFVGDIRSTFTGAVDAPDIFEWTRREYIERQFYRAIEPVSQPNSVETSFRDDVMNLVMSCIVVSIRSTPLDDPLELGVLLSVLLLTVQYYSSTGSENPEIPVNVQDIDKFVEISTAFPEFKNMIKKLFHLLSPRMKSHQLYINRRGTCSVRDNAMDAVVRDLSNGERTGRSVEVVMDSSTNHVTLMNAQTGLPIVDVEDLLKSPWISEEAKKNIREIVSDLNDVIPPPSEEELTSEEDRPNDLLPSESVRKMLRTGRVPKRKQRRVKSEQ